MLRLAVIVVLSALAMNAALALPAASTSSPCSVSQSSVSCQYGKTTMTGREVLYALPGGVAPKAGFPVVLVFHGWYLTPESTFSASSRDQYGLFNKAKTAAQLLSDGYAVIAPHASQADQDAWQTNIPPWASDVPAKYNNSGDADLLRTIFSGFDSGTFGVGCCNINDMHAIGFSSGAYMTSRMAFTYPRTFKSLSIQSGSYYFCGGADCPFPGQDDNAGLKIHPPTLFLHGTNDNIVPPYTSTEYEDNLKQNWSIATVRYTQSGAGHQWINSAPTHIPSWITSHSPTYQARAAPENTTTNAVSQVPREPDNFYIKYQGACLRPTSVSSFGVLRLGTCDATAEWIKWESGAIGHNSNSGLCVRLNAHEQKQKDVCWTGNTLWLEPCFQESMANFFHHDGTSVGSILSELCHGKCLGYDGKEKVTLLDNCTDAGALGWKIVPTFLAPTD